MAAAFEWSSGELRPSPTTPTLSSTAAMALVVRKKNRPEKELVGKRIVRKKNWSLRHCNPLPGKKAGAEREPSSEVTSPVRRQSGTCSRQSGTCSRQSGTCLRQSGTCSRHRSRVARNGHNRSKVNADDERGFRPRRFRQETTEACAQCH